LGRGVAAAALFLCSYVPDSLLTMAYTIILERLSSLARVLSYFAELEAKKTSERTKAVLARAKGKTLGRPDSAKRWKYQLFA
jgi:DNA invertase Pin-like site-specific DNA recombinase